MQIMLKKSFCVFVLGFSLNAHVLASDCLTTDNYVESEGVVCDSGKNMAITSAAEMLIPKDWKMRFLENEVQQQVVAWPKGKLWVDTLDLIGRTSNIGFIVDGHKKIVIAMRPTDNVNPGSVVINSKIVRTREFLSLDEIYARVEDTERVRRENHARKSSTTVPLKKVEEMNRARLSFVNVDEAVFTTVIKEGDLESRLRDFFTSRWGFRLVVNKKGFFSNPKLDTSISLNGNSVVDDANTLLKLLNTDPDFKYTLNIFNGNKVVELTIECGACGYE